MKKVTIISIIALCVVGLFVFILTDKSKDHKPVSSLSKKLLAPSKTYQANKESETGSAQNKTTASKTTQPKQTKVDDSQAVNPSYQTGKSDEAKQIYSQRLEVIASLNNKLDLSERQDLYKFLRNNENDSYTLHVKDEIMRKIEAQEKRPPEYLDQLIDISKDLSLDGDLRGYAVQHIRSAYDKTDEPERKKIKETLYECLEDTKTDVSGTAILALANLSKDYPENFDTDVIGDEAFKLANNESLHIPSRITAVRVCGELGVSDSLKLAKDLATNATDRVLKLVAISTIGDVGTSYDIEMLENFLKNDFYKKAAELAIKKIEQR